MNNNNKFKNRLEELLGKENVTAFARRCGVPEASIRQYLKGHTEPGRKTLLKIANACEVSVGWLASGEGYKVPPPPISGDAITPEQHREHDESVAFHTKMLKDPAWDYPLGQLTTEENAKVKQGEVITRKVLASKGKYANALWENLKAFESAVDTEKEMEGMKDKMERIELLLQELVEAKRMASSPEKKERNQNGSGC